MRQLMRRVNNRNKRGECFYDELGRDMLSYEPIIMDSTVTDTTIWFNSDFTDENIYKLIQDIEKVKQAEYRKLTLYFESNGGSITSLRVLANYLNNKIGDLKIEINVIGLVASAGFYILVMVDNKNINIKFDETSCGLIHLSNSQISCRSLLSQDNERYDAEQFFIKSIPTLNEWLTENYLDKLNLKEEDKAMLQQGKDVMLDAKELERVVTEFHEDRYLESEDCQEEVINLIDAYEEIKARIKYLVNKTPEQVLEELYLFDDEEDECQEEVDKEEN